MILDGVSPAVDRKTRVLIVDDTRTIRAMIRALLSADPRIDIVGEAEDPYQARDLIKSLSPDVLTLDVEMPRMNGLVFLEKLMRLRPMPVVMVSTRTAEQSHDAVKALALGAIDCVDLKRLRRRDPRLPDLGEMLVTAARAKVSRRGQPVDAHPPGHSRRKEVFSWNGRYVFIGSSTGGVDALLKVIGEYPRNGPPTVIVQHMPRHFLESFAQRLNAHSDARVRLAEEGDVLEQGVVLLAPGGTQHLELARGATPRVRLREDDGNELYIPSVSVLFRTLTGLADRTIAVMLTGMGRDGAEEMLALRSAGAITLAQSSETAVVDGMPRAARELGAAMEVVDLDRVTERICSLASRRAERS